MLSPITLEEKHSSLHLASRVANSAKNEQLDWVPTRWLAPSPLTIQRCTHLAKSQTAYWNTRAMPESINVLGGHGSSTVPRTHNLLGRLAETRRSHNRCILFILSTLCTCIGFMHLSPHTQCDHIIVWKLKTWLLHHQIWRAIHFTTVLQLEPKDFDNMRKLSDHLQSPDVQHW